MGCLDAQLWVELAFWLCDLAWAFSAFAFQKESARAAERVEGLLIGELSFNQVLLLESGLGPTSEFFPIAD